MGNEPEYMCSTHLVILGDDLIPEKVTKVLQLEPNEGWIKDQHYVFDKVHEWGGWKCFIPDEKANLELHEQLSWWCDQLEGRETAMRKLEQKDYWLQISCLVQTSSTASIILSADLQKRLSKLRLEIVLSVWVN